MKLWGGSSPLLAMMTAMSITTSSLHGDSSVARLYVRKVDELVVLLMLAMWPCGVNSTTCESGITFSLPSYRTPGDVILVYNYILVT